MSAVQASSPLPLFSGTGLACRRGERLIFRGLDFLLQPGDALVLTGRNGSGKSSLLRLMAGLTPAAAGSLLWQGEPVAHDPAAHRARLNFIGHQEALKPVMSVAETLGFWAKMRGAPTDIDAALEQFQLDGLANQPVRFLSAGQKRRLALARLIASPTELWLLDEPATGLDAELIGDLAAALAAHRANGGCVVLSTHMPLPMTDAMTLSLESFQPERRYDEAFL